MKDEGRSTDEREKEKDDSGITYEEMILGSQRYLCGIPHVDTEETNRTNQAEEATKAEEQTELARATDRGLELLHEMEDQCLYYVSGWWSYSFCYKNKVKQFHARPSGGGIPIYPPMEDPTTHSFVLGRFPRDDDDELESDHKTITDLAELQTKGGTRYLVQRLAGGTKCDLTGKDRKVEVQFHCHPQSTDRIGWIKELTTCSYLMVIYTPRLCNDVAFLPPQQEEAHSIDCREVISPDAVSKWEENSREYRQSQTLEDSAPSEMPIVGGIQVGAKKLVGEGEKRIEKGRVASAGEEKVDVVAKRENGELKLLSKDQLKKYDLDTAKIEQLREQLETMADGKDWTLEVVESNGERQLRGIVDTDEDEDAEAEEHTKDQADQTENPVEKQTQRPSEEAQEDKADRKQKGRKGSSDRDSEEGSEEIFKDEL